jgi:hypothetical protein
VVAAVAPGEGVWLGFQVVARERPVAVRVRLDGPEPRDAVTGRRWEHDAQGDAVLRCPPATRLGGVPLGGGVRLFGTDDAAPGGELERFAVVVDDPAGTASVRLVRPELFTRLTGQVPAPLDPDAAYRGWRLP